MTPFGRLRVRVIDASTQGPLRSWPYSMRAIAVGTQSWVRGYFGSDQVTEVALADGEYNILTHSNHAYRDRWYEGPECTQSNEVCAAAPFHQRGTAVRAASGTTTEIVIALRPYASSIRGVVLDAVTGARISGVTVQVLNESETPLMNGVTSSGDGTFETAPQFEDGTYIVRASPAWQSQYLGTKLRAEVAWAKNPRHEVEIRLERGATLHGHVVDEDGNPIAGARIVVGEQWLTTDSRGRYSFSALQPGIHTIVASREGYDDARKDDIALERGRKTTVDLTMPRKRP
jgi:hypothetical protein